MAFFKYVAFVPNHLFLTLLFIFSAWLSTQPVVSAQDYPNIIIDDYCVRSVRLDSINKITFDTGSIHIEQIDNSTIEILLNDMAVPIAQNPLIATKAGRLNRKLQFKTEFTVKQLYIPGSLIIAGLALNGSGSNSVKNRIVEKRNRYLPNFRVHIDDYLQFSPAVIAYGLDLSGVKSKNDILNRTAILLKGELGMLAITHLLKNVVRIERPDHSDHASFPSGHTAQAFAAATFLSEEYKHKFKWIPYVSYSIAALVGVLRMANNKHYISDVLVGAGIGYLSMKVAYWTHQYKWNTKKISTNKRRKNR